MLLDTSGLLCLHHRAEPFHALARSAYQAARNRLTQLLREEGRGMHAALEGHRIEHDRSRQSGHGEHPGHCKGAGLQATPSPARVRGAQQLYLPVCIARQPGRPPPR